MHLPIVISSKLMHSNSNYVDDIYSVYIANGTLLPELLYGNVWDSCLLRHYSSSSPIGIYGLLLSKPTETWESVGRNSSSQTEKNMAESNFKEKIKKRHSIWYINYITRLCVSESFLQGIRSPLITLLYIGTVDLLFSVSFPTSMNLNKVLLKQLAWESL